MVTFVAFVATLALTDLRGDLRGICSDPRGPPSVRFVVTPAVTFVVTLAVRLL